MDEIKVVEIRANDVSNESREREADPASGPKEARPLKELTRVIAGGGDGIAIW